MAIYYYDEYGKKFNSRNFGDDINPFLLSQLFHKSIIESKDICIVGIGTIINSRHAKEIEAYKHKIVFSSGVGYGAMPEEFDSTWNFICVRGKKTAQVLNLPLEAGVCDGAILLSDYFPLKPGVKKSGTVFIPHVNTGWLCQKGFQQICEELGWLYLSPDAQFDEFIETIQNASLVLTEAMHGAILADTMRTPWLPINFMHHNAFKWQDWFSSIEEPYQSHSLKPLFWDVKKAGLQALLWAPYKYLKLKLVKKALKRISKMSPILSADAIIDSRRNILRLRVKEINDNYSLPSVFQEAKRF